MRTIWHYFNVFGWDFELCLSKDLYTLDGCQNPWSICMSYCVRVIESGQLSVQVEAHREL